MDDRYSLYKKRQCIICKKMGSISIVKNKDYKGLIPYSEVCPLCDGKGFLKIKKGDYE